VIGASANSDRRAPLKRSMDGTKAASTKGATQNHKDRVLTDLRLRDFDATRCPAMLLLSELFGKSLNAKDLESLAETCATHLCLYLDREAKRRKSVLLKWFDENLQVLEPFLRAHVVVETKCQDLLGSRTALEDFGVGAAQNPGPPP